MSKLSHVLVLACLLTALGSHPGRADATLGTGSPLGLPSGPKAPQVDTVIQGASTDRGGTITAGGQAQPLMPANTARRGFTVQNQSTADLYVNCSAAATADWHSLKIPAGALYESPTHNVGPGACSIIGATTGQAFYAREF